MSRDNNKELRHIQYCGFRALWNVGLRRLNAEGRYAIHDYCELLAVCIVLTSDERYADVKKKNMNIIQKWKGLYDGKRQRVV